MVEVFGCAYDGHALGQRVVNGANAANADKERGLAHGQAGGHVLDDPHVVRRGFHRIAAGRRDQQAVGQRGQGPQDGGQKAVIYARAARIEVDEGQRGVPASVRECCGRFVGYRLVFDERADVVMGSRHRPGRRVELGHIGQQKRAAVGPRLGAVFGEVFVKAAGLHRKVIGQANGAGIGRQVISRVYQGDVNALQGRR